MLKGKDMSTCKVCNVKFGWWRRATPHSCGVCGITPLCSECVDLAIVHPATRRDVVGVCDQCFTKHTSLNMEVGFEIITPASVQHDAISATKDAAAEGSHEPVSASPPEMHPPPTVAVAPAAATADRVLPSVSVGKEPWIVLVHGGGGCRAMFRPLARKLARAGFRCLLPDLPGHGGRKDMPLSLQSAVAQLKHDIETNCEGQRPIYLGGSLGGSVGMELLGAHPSLCAAAIICMSGQAVGQGASVKAKAALGAMYYMSGVLTGPRVARQMFKIAKESKNLVPEYITETVLEPGWFFKSRNQQVAVLRETDPLNAVARYDGPVFYINGEEDHRDIEGLLIKSSRVNNSNSELWTIPCADHFFSHDKRFVEDFEARVVEFAVRNSASVLQPFVSPVADSVRMGVAATAKPDNIEGATVAAKESHSDPVTDMKPADSGSE